MTDDVGSRYSVRAAERVMDLLDALRDHPDGASLVALAHLTRMPKSSVFRYLATLETRGYVDKDPITGDYTLGLALPSVREQRDLLAVRVRPTLERLRDRFGETTNLGVIDGDRIIYVEIVESRETMRLAARRGDYDYLHSTALGKAISATRTDDEVRRILAITGMPARTPNTITNVDAFLREVDDVRRRGFAIDDEENEQGARCVAVALTDPRFGAGISVSAPAVRLPSAAAREVALVLRQEVDELGATLGAHPTGDGRPADDA